MKQPIDPGDTANMLNHLAKAAHATATAHGFHDPDLEAQGMARYVANLHEEVAELWVAFKLGRLHEPCDKAEKMRAIGLPALTCAEEEIADIVIRAMDTAHQLGVDLNKAVGVKMAFNQGRPHRHGNKLA